MSGLVLALRRDGAPVEPGVFGAMMECLSPCGVDGRDLAEGPAFRLGHQHLWSTPEEVGERQPIEDPAGDFHLAICGRLDNRDDLLEFLDDEMQVSASSSDAELLAAGYRAWGLEVFPRLIGSWAVVVVDHRQRRTILTRDPLGNRPLVYHLSERVLLAATEEQALIAHPAVSSRMNEAAVARYLSLRWPKNGTTFYADIHAIPPGHALVVERERTRTVHLRTPRITPVRYRSDEDYVEHFRDVLQTSVRSRLRSTGSPAVLMSGGLDSTSVAAVAARELGPSSPLTTVSWVFDDTPESNERFFVEATNDHLGAKGILIPGEGEWPLNRAHGWLASPNQPVEDPYRALHGLSYDAARQAGARTLLTGAYGDHLYYGSEYWLADRLRQRHFLSAARELGRIAWTGHRSPIGAWRTLRGTVARTLGVRRKGPKAAGDTRPWLTEYSRSLAPSDRQTVTVDEAQARARRLMFEDTWIHQFDLVERSHASRAGLDLRHPYRDLRLVELAAGLPAYLLYRPFTSKWILRRAMRGFLPEPVRNRGWASTLAPLYSRGIVDRERHRVSEILFRPDAVWPRFVDSQWMWRSYPSVVESDPGRPAALLPWLCTCLELWSATAANTKTELQSYTKPSEGLSCQTAVNQHTI